MNFVIKKETNATAEKVWRVFADEFDDAHIWMASVPNSYGKENGERFEGAISAGRVCELTPDADSVRASEKFLAFNRAEKKCTVRIEFANTPALFPVQYNTVKFHVVDLDDGKSEITFAFTSRIKPWAYLMWPVVRLAFGVFVGQIVEELKYYVENDTPHPRKLKAMKKLAAV